MAVLAVWLWQGEPGPGSGKEPGAPVASAGRTWPLKPSFRLFTARGARGPVTSASSEETSLTLPAFPLLPQPVAGALPLAPPKQQARGWCVVPLLGKGRCIGILLPGAPGFSPGREREDRSGPGAPERRSSTCAAVEAGSLGFVRGQAAWCCGWALLAQIPGQLLKGFLRDQPKNKPVPYSARAWT